MQTVQWTAPQCSEIKMDAEIGSYQEDFDGERDPLFTSVVREAADTAADAVV